MDIIHLWFYDHCHFLSLYNFNSSFIFMGSYILSTCVWELRFHIIVFIYHFSSYNFEWFYFYHIYSMNRFSTNFSRIILGLSPVENQFPFPAPIEWLATKRINSPLMSTYLRIRDICYVMTSYREDMYQLMLFSHWFRLCDIGRVPFFILGEIVVI